MSDLHNCDIFVMTSFPHSSTAISCKVRFKTFPESLSLFLRCECSQKMRRKAYISTSGQYLINRIIVNICAILVGLFSLRMTELRRRPSHNSNQLYAVVVARIGGIYQTYFRR